MLEYGSMINKYIFLIIKNNPFAFYFGKDALNVQDPNHVFYMIPLYLIFICH